MINDDKMFSLQVYIATENNYFSQGIIFLLTELFNEEYHHDISVSQVDEIAAADLIFQMSAPGEKAFDWVDCQRFQSEDDYKVAMLSKKRVTVYPRSEHYDRNFQCPIVNAVIALKDSVAVIRRRLYMMFFADTLCGAQDLRNATCGGCTGQNALTWREQQMVGYFHLGLGSAEVARLMDCSIKAISNYRRAVMRKLNIKNHSDFALWLATKSVAEKHASMVSQQAYSQDNDGGSWQEKLGDEAPSGVADEKDRVVRSMRRLIDERLQSREINEDIWLTTREIANEMDISIYSMRYLLCQMENNGEVTCTQTGKGRNNTLRWQLAG
ncbi:helix-turn-helix transcriptional regulator [Entomohabitans teleogrylli]|uniref:helix-turn-helix transcriptional regulator n=1 Tax=Entomohabitans teleogrylli TaxID=1384589 RepID=UPI00073D6527|nr:LuxR C-terminal-related transcriptional regulator [Entomohabitans teleogrylli]